MKVIYKIEASIEKDEYLTNEEKRFLFIVTTSLITNMSGFREVAMHDLEDSDNARVNGFWSSIGRIFSSVITVAIVVVTVAVAVVSGVSAGIGF